MDLGSLVQDHVLIESEGPGHLDGHRDAHGGDGGDDVDVEGREHRGQFLTRPTHEADPHVDGNEESQRQLLTQGDEREIDALAADLDAIRAGAHGGGAY